jgi:hypothetical protein
MSSTRIVEIKTAAGALHDWCGTTISAPIKARIMRE